MMIDYQHLADSIKFYQNAGFERLEAPWWVTKEIADLTKPPGSGGDYLLKENNKVLVASAEQSFLYLANKGLLAEGLFQATTPCFRNETIDLLHKKHFIKNELINTKVVSNASLQEMLDYAYDFFSQYIDESRIKVVKTPAHASIKNYDIVAVVNGEELELGSYGIRKCEILKWVYGTGCAEPRLSTIMNRIKLEGK